MARKIRNKKKIVEKKTYNKLRKSKEKQRNLIKDKARHERKKKYRLLIKKHRKEIEKSLKEKTPNPTDLEQLFKQFQKCLDMAAQKGVIHKNNAAGKKSKTRQKINKLIKQNNNLEI